MFDKRLLKAVPEAKKYIVLNALCQWIALLANIVLMVAAGFFLQSLFLGEATIESLQYLCIIGAMSIVVRFAAQMGAQHMSFQSSTTAKLAIRQLVYQKLLRLGPSYSEHISTNKAVQISTEGVEQLEVYFGSYIPQFIYAVAAPITLFFCLAPFSLVVATVLLICTPLIPISMMAIQRVAKRVTRRYFSSYSDLGGVFLENIEGLTTLKIYQADEKQHEKMNKAAESFRQATMRLLRMQLNSITMMDLLAFGGAACGVLLALAQFIEGNITFAGAFVVIFLSAEFFIPLRSLGSLFHTAMNGMAAADTMFELLELPDSTLEDTDIDTTNCVISMCGLSYSYDKEEAVQRHGVGQVGRAAQSRAAHGDALSAAQTGADAVQSEDGDSCQVEKRYALKGVDFQTPARGLIGIVGESGSGKSTLANVLAGRLKGYDGTIMLGDCDMKNMSYDSLAHVLTTVSFSSWIFSGTIQENLLMGNLQATEQQLWDVLSRCKLADFVREQGGLSMPIDEGGSNLSGGQRQRLAFARALLHDTPIYIFDEATSNIDSESERALLAVMKDLAKEHLVITISHRLASVKDASCIYVMEKAHVVEKGTHEELLAHQGAYATLWNKQQELEAFVVVDESVGCDKELRSWPAAQDQLVAQSRAVVQDQSVQHKKAAAQPVTTPQRRSGFSVMCRLIKLVAPLTPFMILAIVLGVLGFLCAIFLTVFGVVGLLDITNHDTIASLDQVFVLVIACGVARGFFHYGEQICNHYIAFKLLALIRDKVFGALRRLAPAKLEGRDKGNLVSLITSDIELLEVFYAHTISPVFIAIITSGIMVAFIAVQSWQLAIVALVSYITIGVCVPLVFSHGTQATGRALRDKLGESNSFVLESLRGLHEILQYHEGQARAKALLDRTIEFVGHERNLKLRTALSTATTSTLILIFDLALIGVAFWLYMQGSITFAEAMTCIVALMSSFGPVIAVAALGTTLQQTIASGARVLDLLDEEPQCCDVKHGRDVEFDGVRVDDVTFAYLDETILQNISIRFDRGSVVNISGKSGSGKSTLLKLLMRFWDPTSGAIEISRTDLREINTTHLRSMESYMTQDTHLFAGTIAENILIARPQASKEELTEACRKAALSEFIDNLPRGLDTQVGELGSLLSGGERQRIGLARVFLHNASFVLLDEPTSNLDSLAEASVLKALAEYRSDKTIVLVSHRASTCSFADVTYSVDHGRLS